MRATCRCAHTSRLANQRHEFRTSDMPNQCCAAPPPASPLRTLLLHPLRSPRRLPSCGGPRTRIVAGTLQAVPQTYARIYASKQTMKLHNISRAACRDGKTSRRTQACATQRDTNHLDWGPRASRSPRGAEGREHVYHTCRPTAPDGPSSSVRGNRTRIAPAERAQDRDAKRTRRAEGRGRCGSARCELDAPRAPGPGKEPTQRAHAPLSRAGSEMRSSCPHPRSMRQALRASDRVQTVMLAVFASASAHCQMAVRMGSQVVLPQRQAGASRLLRAHRRARAMRWGARLSRFRSPDCVTQRHMSDFRGQAASTSRKVLGLFSLCSVE
ncbi:hypothetical protein B0H10DRAFT_334308 [Mycena sp. CBHHK59/15]|nr:hypothetical protein B0H10DRAFT_334308 [Mycena sp. CBHHK59/15]